MAAYPNYGPGGYMMPQVSYNPPPYQPRPIQMETPYQAPYQPQPTPPQAQPQQAGQPNMICRPVASEEEARAVPTDFSGATLILTDFGHGKVYTKSLNYADGSAIFNTYSLNLPAPAASVQTVEYAPLSDVQALQKEVSEIREYLTKPTENRPNKITRGAAEK